MQITIPTPSRRTLATLAIGAVLGLVAATVAARGLRHAPAPPAPAKPDAPAPDAKPEWFGLRYGPDHGAIKASLPKLATVAPHLAKSQDGRPVLLYKAWTEVFASDPPYVPQQIGDCVSFAHGHALDLMQCIDWALKHPGRAPRPGDIQETSTEALYAMSREVGGLLGQGDGSYGAAAVKAMTTIGTVSRRMLGDQGPYSGRRARQWGRLGAPASVKAMAARYRLGAAAQVATWDELVGALSAGHPVTICTQRGFDLTRDAQGFARFRSCWPAPMGCGGHCMFIAGVRFDRPGGCIVQSWGPDTPTGPTALDQPTFSFWADRAAIESILQEGDSWALSGSVHFGAGAGRPARKLPDRWRRAG